MRRPGRVDGDVIRAPATKTMPVSGFVAPMATSSVPLARSNENRGRRFDCELGRVAGL